MRTGYAYLISLFLVPMLGCSVDQKSVLNQPAKIPNPVTKISVDTGELKPSSMMIFIWPEFSTEDEAVQAVVKANRASMKMDALARQYDPMMTEKKEKEEEFSHLQCVQNWADLGPEDDPELIDSVENWKDAPEGDEAAAKERQTCIDNQTRREELADLMDKNTKAQAAEIGVVYTTVDPGYPLNPTGTIVSLDMDYRNSTFKFTPVGRDVKVSITLKNFQGKGNHQSTEEQETTLGKSAMIVDARYDRALQLLFFKVPQVKNGELTGARYEFTVERSNFMTNAKFAGDVKLVLPDGTKKLGSVSFYGPLK